MGAPSDQFLLIQYGGPSQISIFAYHSYKFLIIVRSVYLHAMGGHPRSVSSQTIWEPPQVSFFAYYRGALQISFFAYYMVLPSEQFLVLTIWGSHRISFFAYCMGPLRYSLFAYYMGPLRSVSFVTIWGAPSDQFLCLLYVGAPLDKFLRKLYGGLLRSVSLITMCYPRISFFAYYIEAPSDLFPCILYEGPLRSVSLLTIWHMGLPRSVSSLTIRGPPGQFLRLLYPALLIFYIFYALNHPWGPPYF